ncbi:MAG: tRNA epoxyqueuosine(34) reductase QueG [Bacteroidaceae bacterium]|nr:tRNA epoxyqueuosine(34) reductase QueG [Bacteroidaceae bacterium]
MDKAELTQFIKSEALRLGFDICGTAKAEAVPDDVIRLYNQWIAQEYHGTMQYLQRNCEKRFDPTLLVEGCKSIVVVALNYYPSHPVEGMASYAIGNDYHKIVKDKLYTLLNNINAVHPVKGRAFCDSAPVLERHWAVKAGIGWIGNNRQLIIPHKGSYFFLGELMIDAELEYDEPFTANHCGKCRKCIDNCPTGALSDDGFDARKCLSYLTIEYRGELPENIGKKMENRFYGCDCCLKACPHNRFSTPNNTPEFKPSDELLKMDVSKWQNLTREQYDTLFAKSAVERCGYEQLMRNISAIKEEE